MKWDEPDENKAVVLVLLALVGVCSFVMLLASFKE